MDLAACLLSRTETYSGMWWWKKPKIVYQLQIGATLMEATTVLRGYPWTTFKKLSGPDLLPEVSYDMSQSWTGRDSRPEFRTADRIYLGLES